MPPNKPPDSAQDTAPPLLSLLVQLGNLTLKAGTSGKPSAVKSLALVDGAIELRLSVTGMSALVDGVYLLRLEIIETQANLTRFALSFPQKRGLGRLMELGMKALPSSWLNEALNRFSNGALSVKGEIVVLDHAALLRLPSEPSP